jgi:hypothetical protein
MSEIVQLSTSNTFGQWVSSTQQLITKVNSLTDGGNASIFYANTNLEIGNNVTIGGDLTVTGNIILDDIGFDDLYVNGNVSIANTLSVSNVVISGNVTTLNITNGIEIGGSANIYTDLYVGGNTVFGGSVTLDVVGFNDLDVSGNTDITGTLGVTGNSTFTNANVTGTLTATLAEITTAKIAGANVTSLIGSANTAIYQRIEAAEGTALAFSIALG